MTAAAPYRVDTNTDSHGTYEERWMVPPPADGVTFQVTAESLETPPCDTCDGKGKLGKYPIFNGPDDLTDCPNCVAGLRRVRVIHEWKAVEP